jgi:8-oxo-dGTP diphosphatase
MTRQRVTLFIVEDDKILLIHRIRDGNTYYIVPGGGVEEGETIAAAAHREAAEETSLTIELGPLLWQRPFSTPTSNGEFLEQIEHAYLVTRFSGTPCLSGPEFERQSATNIYTLQWMSLAEFPNQVVYPSSINKAQLLTALNREP